LENEIRVARLLGSHVACLDPGICSDGLQPHDYVSAHREPERSSVVHRVGDLTLITWQDGTTTTMSRQGEFSVVTDSSHGANCVAHHVGDITIVNLEKFTVVCTTTGPSTLCIKS
jgi:hypothetical protein